MSDDRHRHFAGVVLIDSGLHGGIQMPPKGVWANLGADPHEILGGWFELEATDKTHGPGGLKRTPHRWRYFFPASSVLFFIEDLGEIPEEASDVET